MKTPAAIIVVTISVLAAAALASASMSPAERASSINRQRNVHWTASADTLPLRLGRDKFVGLLGLDLSQGRTILPVKTFPAESNAPVPDSFDSRDHWPECETMRDVRDQGHCGSCWAISTAEAISDRECVRNHHNVRISTEDINSCSKVFGLVRCGGCKGGNPLCAIKYWQRTGVVSQECSPYTVPQCASKRRPDSPLPPCPEKAYPTPICRRVCNSTSINFIEDKHRAVRAYVVKGEADMMRELSTNGPCVAGYTVYEDFETYAGGIYHHVSGVSMGGHAVKVVGYGEENGVKYWTIANSWGADWGEQGFFRMRRGTNECGLEDAFYCGIPELSD